MKIGCFAFFKILVELTNYFTSVSAQLSAREIAVKKTFCEIHSVNIDCGANNVIALQQVQYGYATRCSIQCCQTKESGDCLVTVLDSTDFKRVCSGQSSCTPPTVSSHDFCSFGRQAASYVYIEYYCIPKSRITSVCSSNTITSSGEPLYLTNPGYPGATIGTRSCSCSFEAKSCSSGTSSFIIDADLYSEPNTCYQSLQITDVNTVLLKSVKCENYYNSFVTKMNFTDNYVHMHFDSNSTQNLEGYLFIGFSAFEVDVPLSLTCPTRAATWCIDCGLPKNITNGIITLDKTASTAHNETATVTCNPGFDVNTSTIVCREQGIWDRPGCIRKDCGQPANVTNGIVVLNNVINTQFGASAKLTCNPGYNGNTASIVCTEQGIWQSAVCTLKDCGQPANVTNGIVVLNNVTITQFGASAKLTCNPGYNGNTASIVCTEQGIWQSAVCTLKDCGQPANVTNGIVVLNNVTNTLFGASAKLTCNPGYNGNTASIICTEQGIWQSAVCTLKAQSSNIRLSNGTRQDNSNGRLEVLHNNTWGTVCDHKFDNNAATVVCRQLGFTGSLFLSREKSAYGAGSGQIWLDDVSCNGNETNLFNCTHNPWGVNDCGHDDDVGVDCNPNADAFVTLRLVNGSNGNEGRVEVQHNGVWGTVCDDGWDENAAMVTCKQILQRTDTSGLTAIPLAGSFFGSGTGTILLGGVKCTGIEAGIGACAHKPWGYSNCQHNQSSGVMCIGNRGPQNVTVKLTGGFSTFHGRIEIRVYDKWGTICNRGFGDNFGDREATVICRMLGHHSGGRVIIGDIYNGGSGPIWLDDVKCSGNETRIQDCMHKPWGSTNCGHNEDVAVMCLGSLKRLNVRLSGVASVSKGRVEVFHNNAWGTVCSDMFDTKAAVVVCRMLGLPSSGAQPRPNAYFGSGNGTIWLDDARCTGTETSIGDCFANPWGNSNCNHDQDVGVICDTASKKISVGRRGGVDVYLLVDVSRSIDNAEFNATKRFISAILPVLGINDDDDISTRLAINYFASESKKIEVTHFGPPSIKSYTEAQELINSTLHILELRNTTGSGTALAAALDDISIDLETKRFLVERGHNRQAQQVIILLSDGLFSPSESPIQTADRLKEEFDVIIYSIFVGDTYEDQIGYNTMKELASEIDETLCFAIKDTDRSFDHVLDQMIGGSPQRQNVTVRLSGGASKSEGRVEVFYNNAWGTVCSDYFDRKAAAVVCRMLGLPSSDVWPRPNDYYGSGKGTIWLDNVRCTGYETNIGDCNANPWGNNDCNHNEDVGVFCGTPAVTVRLTGGLSTLHGRVEIRVFDKWGTICNPGFGDNEATVICRMLGHNSGGTLLAGGSDGTVGAGLGLIWLSEVKCSGNETRIQDCVQKSWESHYCWHGLDVSVLCHKFQGSLQRQNVTVRLSGGASSSEGRVEVFHNNAWGTVCSDYFDRKAAAVVCKMLGLPSSGAQVRARAYFGRGNGTIWLDDVRCTGNETNIGDCTANPWGNNNCRHYEDVGVVCDKAHTCLDGWLKHGSSCYLFSDITGNITYAQTQCNGSGGYLAEIEDVEENLFLKIVPSLSAHNITGSDYYIGLNDIKQELNYFWFGTNRSLSQTVYSNWAKGEPNNRWSKEDCVVIRNDGYWNDVACDGLFHYICEINY